jgi:hypothetical protein
MVAASKQRVYNFRGDLVTGTSVTPLPEFVPCGQLKTVGYVLGRVEAEMKKGTKAKAYSTVAGELSQDWEKMGVWPKSRSVVSKDIEKAHSDHKGIHKWQTTLSKKPNDFEKRAAAHAVTLAQGFDIKTTDPARIKSMQARLALKAKPEDDAFYQDNCHGPRDMFHRMQPDPQQEKRLARRQGEADRLNKAAAQKDDGSGDVAIVESGRQSDCEGGSEGDSDYEFDDSHGWVNEPRSFPKMPVRSGRNALNETIMRAFVSCLSGTKVSMEDLRKIFVTMGNVVFDQDWDLDSDLSGVAKQPPSASGIKHIRVKEDLSCVFPSARACDRWLKASGMLNLQYLACLLRDKPEETVVTCGTDDGTKAAGNKMFDVKNTHFTLKAEGEARSTYSTGYLENCSHSSGDAARSMDTTFTILGALSGISKEEAKESIDFWQGDRAKEVTPSLHKIGVGDTQITKCNAHIILAFDDAMIKIFCQREGEIGINNLYCVPSAKFKQRGGRTCIFVLGQIALLKCLSPSHAKESISLYVQFCKYLLLKEMKNEFKGFCKNRFGRVGKTARLFLET